MKTFRLVAFALLVSLTWGINLPAAEPALGRVGRPVICHVRLLEGDPRGSIEKGTIRVLSEPTLTTVEGREALFQVGGTLVSQSKGELLFGTLLTVKPKWLERGKCEATLTLEVAEPIKKDGEDIVATAGNTVRASGTFPLGAPTKISVRDVGSGAKLWLEVTFEANEKQAR